MERWIGSCRRECLDNVLIYNARHAERVLGEYIDYHNTARPHRSLRQLAPCDTGEPEPAHSNTKIIRIDRLEGSIPRIRPVQAMCVTFSARTACVRVDKHIADRSAWPAGWMAGQEVIHMPRSKR
jgi:hypothetical protein